MALTKENIETLASLIRDGVRPIEQQLISFQAKTERQFEDLHQRFETIDTRFDQIMTHLDGLASNDETRREEHEFINRRLQALENKLNS